MLYKAEAAALAVLEVRVRLDLDWNLLPNNYVLVQIDVGSLSTETAAATTIWLLLVMIGSRQCERHVFGSTR
jgi:hypothetical protein